MQSRWLYHAVLDADDVGDPYAAASLSCEGFVHCSFAPDVAESVRLYLPPNEALHVWQLDPRMLRARIDLATTPRGVFPHVRGPIERAAIVRRWQRHELDTLPDSL